MFFFCPQDSLLHCLSCELIFRGDHLEEIPGSWQYDAETQIRMNCEKRPGW